ncbi:MAG: hypothetical protein PHE54_02525 [Bacilli bacterium]|nr:hypothetical protein [Bacilli bacterium]
MNIIDKFKSDFVKYDVANSYKNTETEEIKDLRRVIDIIVKLVYEGKKGLEENLTLENSHLYKRGVDTVSLIDEVFRITSKYPFQSATLRLQVYTIDKYNLIPYYQAKLKQYHLSEENWVHFWEVFIKANMLDEISCCIKNSYNNWPLLFNINIRLNLQGTIDYCFQKHLFSTSNDYDNIICLLLTTGSLSFIDKAINTNNLKFFEKILSDMADFDEAKKTYYPNGIIKEIKRDWDGKKIMTATFLNYDELALYLYDQFGLGNKWTSNIIQNIISMQNYHLLTDLFAHMVKRANKTNQHFNVTQKEFDDFLKSFYAYFPPDNIIISKVNDQEILIERKAIIDSFIASITIATFKTKQNQDYFASLLPQLIKYRDKNHKKEEQLSYLINILSNIRNNALITLASNHEVGKTLNLKYKTPRDKK